MFNPESFKQFAMGHLNAPAEEPEVENKTAEPKGPRIATERRHEVESSSGGRINTGMAADVSPELSTTLQSKLSDHYPVGHIHDQSFGDTGNFVTSEHVPDALKTALHDTHVESHPDGSTTTLHDIMKQITDWGDAHVASFGGNHRRAKVGLGQVDLNSTPQVKRSHLGNLGRAITRYLNKTGEDYPSITKEKHDILRKMAGHLKKVGDLNVTPLSKTDEMELLHALGQHFEKHGEVDPQDYASDAAMLASAPQHDHTALHHAVLNPNHWTDPHQALLAHAIIHHVRSKHGGDLHKAMLGQTGNWKKKFGEIAATLSSIKPAMANKLIKDFLADQASESPRMHGAAKKLYQMFEENGFASGAPKKKSERAAHILDFLGTASRGMSTDSKNHVVNTLAARVAALGKKPSERNMTQLTQGYDTSPGDLVSDLVRTANNTKARQSELIKRDSGIQAPEVARLDNPKFVKKLSNISSIGIPMIDSITKSRETGGLDSSYYNAFRRLGKLVSGQVMDIDGVQHVVNAKTLQSAVAVRSMAHLLRNFFGNAEVGGLRGAVKQLMPDTKDDKDLQEFDHMDISDIYPHIAAHMAGGLNATNPVSQKHFVSGLVNALAEAMYEKRGSIWPDSVEQTTDKSGKVWNERSGNDVSLDDIRDQLENALGPRTAPLFHSHVIAMSRGLARAGFGVFNHEAQAPAAYEYNPNVTNYENSGVTTSKPRPEQAKKNRVLPSTYHNQEIVGDVSRFRSQVGRKREEADISESTAGHLAHQVLYGSPTPYVVDKETGQPISSVLDVAPSSVTGNPQAMARDARVNKEVGGFEENSSAMRHPNLSAMSRRLEDAKRGGRQELDEIASKMYRAFLSQHGVDFDGSRLSYDNFDEKGFSPSMGAIRQLHGMANDIAKHEGISFNEAREQLEGEVNRMIQHHLQDHPNIGNRNLRPENRGKFVKEKVIAKSAFDEVKQKYLEQEEGPQTVRDILDEFTKSYETTEDKVRRRVFRSTLRTQILKRIGWDD